MDAKLSNSSTMVTAKNNATRPKPTSNNEITSKISTSDVSIATTRQATHNSRKVHQALGHIIPQRHRYAYISYSIILNFLIGIFFPISFGVSYWRLTLTHLSKAEFATFLTSLQVYFNVWSSEIRIWMMTPMQSKLRAAEKIVERLDRRCRQSAEEMEELRLCTRFCNRLVTFYVIFYWVYSTATFVGAFLKGQPPYNIYLPLLDWRRSHFEFLIASFIEFLLMTVTTSQQAFNDTFALVTVYILRTHMRILLIRFARLGKASSSLSLDENLTELKLCIKDHKNYLEFYESITPIITSSIFVHFLITAVSLSTSLLNILLIGTDLNSRIGSFVYIAALFGQVVPVCYFAQCLMDDSNRLAEVIFHSDWIKQDVRYRKMLIFLLHRTQSTKYMIAGKLFPINLSCCFSIIKFAFSLYTVITTMDLQQKFV